MLIKRTVISTSQHVSVCHSLSSLPDPLLIVYPLAGLHKVNQPLAVRLRATGPCLHVFPLHSARTVSVFDLRPGWGSIDHSLKAPNQEQEGRMNKIIHHALLAAGLLRFSLSCFSFSFPLSLPCLCLMSKNNQKLKEQLFFALTERNLDPNWSDKKIEKHMTTTRKEKMKASYKFWIPHSKAF